MDFSQIYKSVESSVVKVQTGVIDNNKVILQGVGTGVIVLDGKTVLTCAHCVDNQNGSVTTVAIPGTNAVEIAKIKFIDTDLDIALLVLDTAIARPAKVISSNNMEIGMECFVVGHPNSIPQKTFLSGHVATIMPQHLLLDCSVNHGNSGGPLFDVNGNVVGIVNAKHGGLNQVLEDLLNHKSGAMVSIGGVDPVKSLKYVVVSMKRNLNLGIGHAIKTDEIKKLIPNLY